MRSLEQLWRVSQAFGIDVFFSKQEKNTCLYSNYISYSVEWGKIIVKSKEESFVAFVTKLLMRAPLGWQLDFIIIINNNS